ncbi:abc transporter c family member 10 [Nicotiana attenuata]|uniref:Abc transporter c family member 10 n=1 Tax=Nicotiana attenuata TaxID=49451 RepID=A0A314L5B5_NICAT|nr:abc transporter c family member 10 [Nicotiana attenuata]
MLGISSAKAMINSSLTAAIFQKQLHVSNAAKTTHSPAHIMNYVTVDAHKIGNNPKMFEEFKEAMAREFEMTDIGLMSYYLGIQVHQRKDEIFISQGEYAKEILKKFEMDNCNPVSTPVECGVKISKHGDGENVNPTFFKSLVGSLRYLTCTRPDILYGVGLVSRFMEAPTTSHLKVAKRILRYIKDTLDYEILYSSSKDSKFVGYCDSDWAGDIDDRKSTTGFVFFLGNSAFTWNSKKQPIVTLSTCEAEYVAACSCVCHAIWLRSLLEELHQPQKDATKIFVDNKSAIELAKNPVFHERSKHIDTRIFLLKVLEKCQLREVVQGKETGLDSSVLQDGSNWSMGQRQLFCLGRALLKRSRILVLDEATASIDNATDAILPKIITLEFVDCTVIAVAHRIPTVMDYTKVLAISDGKLVEFDEPKKLISKDGSLFGELVKEYWARAEK